MSRKIVAAALVLAAGLVSVLVWFVHSHNLAVLNPAGVMAARERNLIILSTLLMLIVVVPVYIFTVLIAVKYRAGNTRAKYSPNWDHDRRLEFLWWAIPCVIIGILAVITWQSSHALDPYRPLHSSVKPLTVQVVALDWKWLFIYPELDVASVNQLELPVGRPVDLQITSDAPMNSLWIPQLSGQVYAMPGMSTELHMQADQAGSYYGDSANISGSGFAGMHFQANAVSAADFVKWASAAQESRRALTREAYAQLAQPSGNASIATYSPVADGLYDDTVTKYMVPSPSPGQPMGGVAMPGMDISSGGMQ